MDASFLDASFLDASFLDLALGANSDPARLERHPALDAILRHKRLFAPTETDRAALVRELLDNVSDPIGAKRVAAAWRGRPQVLAQHIELAFDLLPHDFEFSGRLFFIVGYDRGFAAPPDITINVGHALFVADPDELPFYVTHEAHHLGFLERRPMPSLTNFETAQALRSMIAYATQLEGMAVHAAYAPRSSAGALDKDPDYEVYTDQNAAKALVERYATLLASIPERGPVTADTAQAILGSMSAKDRLWYRFGAMVSRNLERTHGREALIRSIDEPHLFETASQALLRA